MTSTQFQIVCYKSRDKTRRDVGTVCELSRGEIRPGDSCLWNDEVLEVPPLPPTRLDFCSIINLSYCLEVRYVVFERILFQSHLNRVGG